MEITLYTKSICPHCVRAKSLLDELGKPYTDHVMDDDPVGLDAAKSQGGRPTVAIVVIDGRLIGGGSELGALVEAGGLA